MCRLLTSTFVLVLVCQLLGHKRFCVSLAVGNPASSLAEDTSINVELMLEDQVTM